MPDGSARLVVEATDGPPELDAAINSVLRANQPAILDSSLAHPAHGRYSILACDPAETITCPNPPGTDPFAMLDGAIATTPRIGGALPVEAHVPFSGGWIGFLAYEAGRWLECLPARTGGHRFLPTAWFALYDTAAIYDRLRKRWLLAGVDWPRDSRLGRRPPVKKRIQKLQATLCQGVAKNGCEYSQTMLRARPDFSRRQYERAVARAIEYIAAGDIFQVNLSQRLVVTTDQDPGDLFLRLRRHNPSFFGAYLRPPGAAIVSASPELFLSLRGRDVVTRPIKGTRRRAADPSEDARLRNELWQ
ncbi:MAG: chorismate-binding protein, partial [Phycisphaerae bacterium]